MCWRDTRNRNPKTKGSDSVAYARYMNPKYARRKKKRRRAVVVTAALMLTLLAGGVVLRIDNTIRTTMLPNAPPVAALRQEEPWQYRLDFFGESLRFSTKWATGLRQEFSVLLRTPPAPVRLLYQLRAWVTGVVPRNTRDDAARRKRVF